MRTTLNILLYTLVFVVLGSLAVAFAFHLVELKDIITILVYAYQDLQIRLITGLSGFVCILLSFSIVQSITGKIQREKTIAFNNPNGQVTITLSAVEDLIKRLAGQQPEIKDARADVKATKKGIDVSMKIILRTETSVPDFTSKLQEIIASRIQDVFGIEETINVKIHVAKIITTDDKAKKKRDKNQEQLNQEDIAIPYQGIKI
ncbi:MAG: alkaline shock response membrane anchor protein AmaP [Candidatus Omnitrophota bacterium]